MVNEYLALAFRSFDKRKAERLRDCSTFLQFKVYSDGSKKLNSMNSCHVRLCPICSWRRSLKTYANIRKVTEYLHEKEQRQFVFVTLTVESTENTYERIARIKIDGGNSRVYDIVLVQTGRVPSAKNEIKSITLRKSQNKGLDRDYVMKPDENGVFSCYIPAIKTDAYIHISEYPLSAPEHYSRLYEP